MAVHRTRSPLTSDQFRLTVLFGALTTESMSALCSGQSPAILVKNAMSIGDAAEFTKRFWTHEDRRPRRDGVDGYYIGAYHYAKKFEDYVEEVNSSEGTIDELFAELDDPRVQVSAAIRSLPEKPVLRRARWHDRSASPARALSWTSNGRYLLDPHDDVGQLRDPTQAGFEIQEVAESTVVAVNIYPLVPPDGGALRVWNFRPTDRERAAFGVETTGFPYPEASLAGMNYFDIPVETGSMAIIDGGLVHAVVGYQRHIDTRAQRLLVNVFYGMLRSGDFVYWV